MVFGGITVGCGLAGTIGGGLLLDYVNSTISNAFKVKAKNLTAVFWQRAQSRLVFEHCTS